MFTLNIEKPKLDPYSKRQHNADVFCACCGRGIPNRETSVLAIQNRDGSFKKISDHDHENEVGLGFDPVGWACFVGSTCAKQLPKEYRCSWKRAMKAWAKTDYQNT